MIKVVKEFDNISTDILVSNSDPIIWAEEEKEKFLKILKEIIRGL